MTMFNKDQIFQLLESRDGEALRALWQGRGAVDIAALLDSVEDGARQAAVFRTLPKDLAADVFSYSRFLRLELSMIMKLPDT